MNHATRTRRVDLVSVLLKKLEKNHSVIKHTDFQDEMGFLSQTPINSQNDHGSFKGQKKDVPDKSLSHQTNRERLKVMVSAAFACLGVTKPLFINKKRTWVQCWKLL